MVPPIDRRHGDGIQTPNRRLGRYFIASQHLVPAEAKRASEAKAHLKDMCDMIVSGKANDMTPPEVNQKNVNMFTFVPPKCHNFLHMQVIDKSLQSLELLQASAKVFHMLSYEASLTVFFNL